MLLQHANWKGAATSCLQHNKSRLGKTLMVNNSNNNKPESRLKASPAAPRTARKLQQKLVPHSVHFDKLCRGGRFASIGMCFKCRSFDLSSFKYFTGYTQVAHNSLLCYLKSNIVAGQIIIDFAIGLLRQQGRERQGVARRGSVASRECGKWPYHKGCASSVTWSALWQVSLYYLCDPPPTHALRPIGS